MHCSAVIAEFSVIYCDCNSNLAVHLSLGNIAVCNTPAGAIYDESNVRHIGHCHVEEVKHAAGFTYILQ